MRLSAARDINLLIMRDTVALQQRARDGDAHYIAEMVTAAVSLDDLDAASILMGSPQADQSIVQSFAQRKTDIVGITPRAKIWVAVHCTLPLPGLADAFSAAIHQPDMLPLVSEAWVRGIYQPEWCQRDVEHIFTLAADQYRGARDTLLALDGVALKAALAAARAGNDRTAVMAIERIKTGGDLSPLTAAYDAGELPPLARAAVERLIARSAVGVSQSPSEPEDFDLPP